MTRTTQTDIGWIAADWPAPAHVHAGVTTRTGGASIGTYQGFNLATHVGDQAESVSANRKYLVNSLHLPAEPAWLTQVHGSHIITLSDSPADTLADGSYTRANNQVCAVLTADCLPLLLCDVDGREIAAVHVGWRGYCAGIIDSALSAFAARGKNLLAWMGPCISAACYEVGDEVRQACLAAHGIAAAFTAADHRSGHWQADLGLLVKHSLNAGGVTRIYESGLCTFSNPEQFYSYRRDGNTGRIASLIWMD